MNDELGSEYVGQPLSEAPKAEPTSENCMGRKKMKRDGEVVRDANGEVVFGGYCRAWPGKGTDHVGEGRCSNHGGSGGAPSGPENGNYKHGLFADTIREEDRATLKQIEELSTAAKLEETLNMQVLKLHRAIEGMESEERASFMDVFEDMVEASVGEDGELEKSQLRYLAQMLGENDAAVREWMDLIRRTAKDLHKITDGEEVRVEHGVDSGELEELEAMADELF